MSQTKQFFIDKAFEEIGLAAYVFDLQPEDYGAALARANAMIGAWMGNGILIGDWPIYDDPNEDWIGQPVAIPFTNWEVIWLNLGLALAPNVGKTPDGPTISRARLAYRTLLDKRVEVQEMKRPSTMPIGTGWNRSPKDRQFYYPSRQLDDGAGNSLGINVWDGNDTIQVDGFPVGI
jgi:hypothetical protein